MATIQGYQIRIPFKSPCRVATTGNIAVLAGGAPDVVDGINLVLNARVLVWRQGAGATHGVYRVQTVGTGANGTWVRDTDFETATENAVQAGLTLFVQEGTLYAGHTFLLSTTGAITIGVTALVFNDASVGLDNNIYVDGGANGLANGTPQYPYHTVDAALAVSSTGDTIVVAPGTYTITVGLNAVAGVKIKGSGTGGYFTSPTGSITTIELATAGQTILTVAVPNVEVEGVHFLCTTSDTAKLPALTSSADNTVFRNCIFQTNRASATPALVVNGGATPVLFDDCFFLGNNHIILTTSAGVGTTTLQGCEFRNAEPSIAGAYVDIRDCNFASSVRFSTTNRVFMEKCTIYGDVVITGAGYYHIHRCFIESTASPLQASGAGIIQVYHSHLYGDVGGVYIDAAAQVIVRNSYIEGGDYAVWALSVAPATLNIQTCEILGGIYGVYFAEPPHANSRIDHNVFLGGVPDIFVGNGKACTLASLVGNSMPDGITLGNATSYLYCPNNPLKNVGGGVDAFATAEGAVACAGAGDVIVLSPGTHTLTGSLTPAVSPLSIRGVDQNTCILSRGAGAAIATTVAAQALNLSNLTLVGSLDVTGNGAALNLTGAVLTGLVDVQGGDATTTVRIERCRITGNATDKYGIRFASASPKVYVYQSYLKGDAGDPAIYWDGGVTNNDLRLSQSTVIHGSVGANNPFGVNAAQTPNYTSHHCTYNALPHGAGFTNLIATPYDVADPLGDY